MKRFLDDDFLLSNDTAKHLYHDYASVMPIIDYHCHLSPQEIYEDRRFENITQVWLGGDHYKWRIMRAHGVLEKFITGDGDDHEKFLKWADVIAHAIGNPLYHWSHMELRIFFGYDGILNADTAEEVWNLCNEKLKTMTARDMIRMAHVTHLCTTDDPVDDLHWHQLLREDASFETKVMPAWRPDKAMAITSKGYGEYINKLESVCDMTIDSYDSLMAALYKRIAYFAENGCTVSDHGMDTVVYEEAEPDEVNRIFVKALQGETISSLENRQFRTAFLRDLGREYAKRNWVMQIHYGVIRDNNEKIYKLLGADAGIDSIGDQASIRDLAGFLNGLARTDELPKTIVYSLNPNDNTAIETVLVCFQDGSCKSKLQHGAAWWFNDHKTGMIAQMTSLANEGMLCDFVGMLTDSRSFLSYARHDYFRRILCDLIGSWVENGEYPEDEKILREIVEGISYTNAKEYFSF